jgi:hypothetical protein
LVAIAGLMTRFALGEGSRTQTGIEVNSPPDTFANHCEMST